MTWHDHFKKQLTNGRLPSDFQKWSSFVTEMEGGYAFDPYGGHTIAGVTLSTFQNSVIAKKVSPHVSRKASNFNVLLNNHQLVTEFKWWVWNHLHPYGTDEDRPELYESRRMVMMRAEYLWRGWYNYSWPIISGLLSSKGYKPIYSKLSVVSNTSHNLDFKNPTLLKIIHKLTDDRLIVFQNICDASRYVLSKGDKRYITGWLKRDDAFRTLLINLL